MVSLAFGTTIVRAIGISLTIFSAHASANDPADFHNFDDEYLEGGRQIWLGTCVNCHATGFASAPAVTNYTAWEKRLTQEQSDLYLHALEGFYGEDYAYMPPRGGNDALSDEEVKSAVDYMTALVKQLQKEVGE